MFQDAAEEPLIYTLKKSMEVMALKLYLAKVCNHSPSCDLPELHIACGILQTNTSTIISCISSPFCCAQTDTLKKPAHPEGAAVSVHLNTLGICKEMHFRAGIFWRCKFSSQV
jgi:hypothetical protein